MFRKINIAVLFLIILSSSFQVSAKEKEELYPYFYQINWNQMEDIEKQKHIESLIYLFSEEYNTDIPEICYSELGEYVRARTYLDDNKIEINNNFLFSSQIMFTTIVHEMTHVKQKKYNPDIFENYTKYDEDIEQYLLQECEMEAKNNEEMEYNKLLTFAYKDYAVPIILQ